MLLLKELIYLVWYCFRHCQCGIIYIFTHFWLLWRCYWSSNALLFWRFHSGHFINTLRNFRRSPGCQLVFSCQLYIEVKLFYLSLLFCIFVLKNRILFGVAESASYVAVMGIMMKIWPDRISQIISWTESIFSIGFTIGKFRNKMNQ